MKNQLNKKDVFLYEDQEEYVVLEIWEPELTENENAADFCSIIFAQSVFPEEYYGSFFYNYIEFAECPYKKLDTICDEEYRNRIKQAEKDKEY